MDEVVVQVNRQEFTFEEYKMIFAAREPFPLVRPGDRIAFTAKNLKVTITHIDRATAEKFRDPPVAPLVFEDDKPLVWELKDHELSFHFKDEFDEGRLRWKAETNPSMSNLRSLNDGHVWGTPPHAGEDA